MMPKQIQIEVTQICTLFPAGYSLSAPALSHDPFLHGSLAQCHSGTESQRQIAFLP